MSKTVELTDDLEKRLRAAAQNGIADAGQTVTQLIREIVALMPPDPRNLPPGSELDKITCETIKDSHYGHPTHSCSAWSSSYLFVGRMLEWFYTHGYIIHISDRRNAQKGLPNVTIRVFSSTGYHHFLDTISGETVQHALAIAISVIGGRK